MRKVILFIGVVLMIGNALCAMEEIRITVGAGERQVFKGLGASMPNPEKTLWTVGNANSNFFDLDQNVQDTLAKLIWGDLNFRFMRIWTRRNDCGSAEYKDDFCADYYGPSVAGHIALAKKHQPELQTTLGPHTSSYAQEQIGNIQTWASNYAHQMQKLRDNYGITINNTGVANEPDMHDILTPEKFRDIIKHFRAELDKRGLDGVKILGPETSSADSKARGFVEAVLNDRGAFRDLDAICTHSYNWSITDEMEEMVQDYILSGEKEYWQTEGGTSSLRFEEVTEDDNEHAADVIAKYLGDMNHLCNVWIHYQSLRPVGPDWTTGENPWSGDIYSTNCWSLIPFRVANNDFFITLKYHYFKQISRTQVPGAVFRKSVANVGALNERLGIQDDGKWKYWRQEDSTMVCAYGEKAPLYLAAALNPDSSWGIAVTNYTGFAKGNPISTPRPKMDYKITVVVEELANSGSVPFTMHRVNNVKRTGSDHYIHDEGTVTMTNGEIIIDSLGQYELVTLKSAGNGSGSIRPAGGSAMVRGLSSLSARVAACGKRVDFVIDVPSTGKNRNVPVRMAIYTSKGALVETICDKNIGSGPHTVIWDSSNRSTGLYLVMLKIGNVKNTGSIIIQ